MKRLCLVLATAALIAALFSCGSSSSNNSNNNHSTPPPPTLASISVSPASPSITVAATQQFTATAKDSNGNTMTGVTFTWASSATTVATINSTGLATAVSAGTTQITASASGVTSSNDTLTVTDPVATITVSPSSPSIAAGATQQFTATAKDSGGNTLSGITFTWASTVTGVATINTSGLATGVSTGTTQITASAGGVTSANDTLTVTPRIVAIGCTSGSESLLNGGYAFLLKGFDQSGNPALVVGALTFDGNGAITAGSIDENLNSGVESNLSVSSGNYNVGNDQRGCLVLTTSAGTQSYRFSVGGISGGVASTGHLIDFDSAGPFTTGILSKQSGGPFTNASANGSYAFGGSALQNAAHCAAPCKFATIGVITFDGTGGVSGGSEDVNENGTLDGNASNTTWPASPIPIDSGGTYSVSSTGRAALAISFAGGSSSANNVLYLVSSSEAFFMSSDPQTTGSITAGRALLQSGAPFAANPLSGSYVGYDSGIGITSGLPGGGRSDLYLLGPFTSGNNALDGVQYRDNGGTFGSLGFPSSTYSVSSIGRSVVSCCGHAPLLYLVSTSQAFFLQSNVSVDDGFFELQSGGPFSTSSATGTYAIGFIDPELTTLGAVSGIATLTPASNTISLTLDANVGGTSIVGQTQNQTYSIDSTGLVLEPLGCSISVTPPTCDSVLYVISPTKAVSMDTQSSNPKIVTADK
ncbi:MAG TPA: Ig-like domain-containing protein [Terriglobales bacterium]|nr:Ig-like domain-containing protein [Terriglobales bacterium]